MLKETDQPEIVVLPLTKASTFDWLNFTQSQFIFIINAFIHVNAEDSNSELQTDFRQSQSLQSQHC